MRVAGKIGTGDKATCYVALHKEVIIVTVVCVSNRGDTGGIFCWIAAYISIGHLHYASK